LSCVRRGIANACDDTPRPAEVNRVEAAGFSLVHPLSGGASFMARAAGAENDDARFERRLFNRTRAFCPLRPAGRQHAGKLHAQARQSAQLQEPATLEARGVAPGNEAISVRRLLVHIRVSAIVKLSTLNDVSVHLLDELRHAIADAALQRLPAEKLNSIVI
jgi:hypothetical protein